MIVFSGLRYAAPVLLLLLAGCSASEGSDEAKSTATASPSKNPLIGGPAPSAALEPAPSITSGDDARELLRPGGDVVRLAVKVPDDVRDLESLHVEQTYTGSTELQLSYDVDGTGRCSGEGAYAGQRFRFVTTSDGRLLVNSKALGERWTTAPLDLADYCPGGPIAVAYSTTGGAGSEWMLSGAKRIGVERVGGRSAVHFRKSADGTTVDSWIVAAGPDTRLLKLVTRRPNGNVNTRLFSDFDSAGPIEPEPPASQVVKPGTSTT